MHWAGRIDWNRPRYYASADVFCTPCQRASFGMVLLEAMSCGRPVVGSMISGFERLLTSGREGLLVAPQDDPAAFASALVHLLGSPAELARMGAEGRVTATTRYAWSSVAAELEAYYLELRGELPVTVRAAHRRRASTRLRHASDTMPGVARLAFTWLPPLVWMVVIFAFSSQHGGGHLPESEVLLRKLGHVTGYLVLTILLLRALRRSGVAAADARSRSRRRSPTRSATNGTSRSCPAARRRRSTSRIDGIGIGLAALTAGRTRRARAARVSTAVVFVERAIAPGGDAIWPAALEHLARRFASIRELDVAAVPARESAVAGARVLGRRRRQLVAARARPLLRRPRPHAPAPRPGHRRAARLAAPGRRAARRLRSGAARGLGRHARVPRPRPPPRRDRARARR